MWRMIVEAVLQILQQGPKNILTEYIGCDIYERYYNFQFVIILNGSTSFDVFEHSVQKDVPSFRSLHIHLTEKQEAFFIMARHYGLLRCDISVCKCRGEVICPVMLMLPMHAHCTSYRSNKKTDKGSAM